jgi:hypothetical protein
LDETASGGWPTYHASDARIPGRPAPVAPGPAVSPVISSSAPVSMP